MATPAARSPRGSLLWTPAARPPLTGGARADVCVIGAGIAGLSVAYHLAIEGHRVLVLQDGPIGGGQSGRTTAHLSNAIDDLYVEIARVHGEAGARLAAESHTAAIDRIERIAGSEDRLRLRAGRRLPVHGAGESPDIFVRSSPRRTPPA